jgi:hypothetical protein
VPLDVLVIDMDWHLTFGPSSSGEKLLDQSGHEGLERLHVEQAVS